MLGFVYGRLKELGIADLLYLSQPTLLLQPVDERLHGCVSDAFVVREAFQDLAHGRSPQFPVLFQDASFGFGKTRLFHHLLPIPAMLLQGTACWHDSSPGSGNKQACASVPLNALAIKQAASS